MQEVWNESPPPPCAALIVEVMPTEPRFVVRRITDWLISKSKSGLGILQTRYALAIWGAEKIHFKRVAKYHEYSWRRNWFVIHSCLLFAMFLGSWIIIEYYPSGSRFDCSRAIHPRRYSIHYSNTFVFWSSSRIHDIHTRMKREIRKPNVREHKRNVEWKSSHSVPVRIQMRETAKYTNTNSGGGTLERSEENEQLSEGVFSTCRHRLREINLFTVTFTS